MHCTRIVSLATYNSSLKKKGKKRKEKKNTTNMMLTLQMGKQA